MAIKIFSGSCFFKGFFSVLMFILGLTFLTMNPVGYIVKKTIQISKGSFVENLWMTVPVEVNNHIYVFNITNAEEFTNGDDTVLKFQEIGPYVYKEKRGNVNITYHENGTMTYVPTLTLPYMEDLSTGDVFNDTVVTINTPLLAFLSLYSDASSFKKFGVNIMIKSFNPKPFLEMPVYDLLWGYEDKMVSSLSTMMPGWIDFEKFGILDRVYAYKRDEVTVNYKDTAGLPYEIEYWNGSPGMSYWGYEDANNSLRCNRLEGAFEGLIFPPNHRPENDTYRVYKKIFCRPLDLELEDVFTDSDGLVRNSYRLSSSEFDCEDPKNSCYCPEDGPEFPNGVADLHPCYYDLPFGLSKPHFYEGDPKLLEPFEGLKPEKELHRTIYVIQPDIGLPVEISAKAQLNVIVRDVNYNSIGKPFTNKIIPVMWIDSKMDALPDFLMLLIKLAFVYLPIAQVILGWSFLIGGLIWLFYNTMSILKPTQEWVERQTTSQYPGSVPTSDPSDRQLHIQEEMRTFV